MSSSDEAGKARRPLRLRVGETIEARFESMDTFGSGMGHPEGHELPHVHCPDVFTGERASVRVLAIAKRARPVRAHTRVLEVLEAHPGRREYPCAQHQASAGRCGGCPLMGLNEASQRELKITRVREQLGLRVDAMHAAPEAFGYRWSAKRVVGGRRGELVFGSFIPRTHRVADMRGCLVDHPKIVDALTQLRERANSMQISAWRAPGDGELRYVWAKTNGDAVLLTLLGSGAARQRLDTLAKSLRAPAGVFVGVRDEPGNAVRGDEEERALETVCGLPELPYDDAGVRESLGPLGFLQPNPVVAAQAYDALTRDVAGQPLSGDLAFDLYAGAGVTTTRLQRGFERVRPVESYAESANHLGVPAETAADFLQAYVGPTPELIVANPPRAGLGATVCEQLGAMRAPRLHVMSCSPDSFKRDLEALSAAYELEGIELFDTLPQTAHVELVAWLRAKPQ